MVSCFQVALGSSTYWINTQDWKVSWWAQLQAARKHLEHISQTWQRLVCFLKAFLTFKRLTLALECLRDIGLEEECTKLAVSNESMLHTRWCKTLAGEEYARIYSWGNDPKRQVRSDRKIALREDFIEMRIGWLWCSQPLQTCRPPANYARTHSSSPRSSTWLHLSFWYHVLVLYTRAALLFGWLRDYPFSSQR